MRSPFIIFALLYLSAGLTLATDADLQQLRTSLDQKINTYIETNRELDAQKANLATLKRDATLIDKDLQAAKKNRDRLDEIELENPGSVTAALSKATEEYNRLAGRKREISTLTRINTEKQEALKTRLGAMVSDTSVLRRQFDARLKLLTDRQLQDRITAMRVSKQVEAEASAACGDMSVSACKKKARTLSEQKAIEQGSVIVVDAMTEMQNFKLTSEQIRSEVRGELADVVELQAGFVNDEVYKTRIRAKVTPVISDSMQRQIRRSIQTEILDSIGGEPNFSLLKDVPTRRPSDEEEAEQERREEARRLAEERDQERKEQLERDKRIKEENDRLAKDEADRKRKALLLEQQKQEEARLKAEKERKAQEDARKAVRTIPSF